MDYFGSCVLIFGVQGENLNPGATTGKSENKSVDHRQLQLLVFSQPFDSFYFSLQLSILPELLSFSKRCRLDASRVRQKIIETYKFHAILIDARIKASKSCLHGIIVEICSSPCSRPAFHFHLLTHPPHPFVAAISFISDGVIFRGDSFKWIRMEHLYAPTGSEKCYFRISSFHIILLCSRASFRRKKAKASAAAASAA
jgi:hypothetical protein